jgi:hypothetical protein
MRWFVAASGRNSECAHNCTPPMRPLSMLRHLHPLRFAPVVCAVLIVPTLARAECVTPTPARINEYSTELVFSGRVEGLNQVNDLGVHVTFNVDRVWKGSVPKRFELYVWQLNSEAAKFEFQRPYIVFAYRMPERDRQHVGLTDRDPIAFTATSCGAVLALTRASSDANASEILRQLGEGQPAR